METACQTSPSRAIAGGSLLRLPAWVLAKISTRPAAYTGQLTVNFFQGGVTTIEWREIMKELK